MNRAQAAITPWVTIGVIIAILLIGIVIVDGVGIDRQSVETEYEQARAYCYQAYGDPAVYNAQVIGNHGGVHCEANDGNIHLHDVSDQAKMAAYYANESNQTVDQWPDNRYEPPHERGWIPTLLSFGALMGMVLLVGAVLKYGPGMAGGRR